MTCLGGVRVIQYFQTSGTRTLALLLLNTTRHMADGAVLKAEDLSHLSHPAHPATRTVHFSHPPPATRSRHFFLFFFSFVCPSAYFVPVSSRRKYIPYLYCKSHYTHYKSYLHTLQVIATHTLSIIPTHTMIIPTHTLSIIPTVYSTVRDIHVSTTYI